MSVSIKQIAKMCGVSEGTVDRAINNRPGIKEETKQKILAVAKKMNYQPNHLARCLATGCTKTIGVVCLDICNSFFSSLINVIEEIAKENGYFITLIVTRSRIEKEIEGINYLAGRKVDGLILFPAVKGNEYENMLKNLNIPIVTIYNRISPEFVHIDVDCRKIMEKAVEFIADKGYDNIAYMDVGRIYKDSRNNVYSFKQRLAGYMDGVKKIGMKKQVFSGFKEANILEYINNTPGKKAFLCTYDTYAVRILSMSRKYNIKVPEDIGLMGFNNMDVLNDIYPRIYSVDCNIELIGTTAFNKLYELMQGKNDVEDAVIDYRFSEGNSL